MMSFVMLSAVAALGQPPAVPHLSQAWVAQSSGDGEPGETGKETYLYEECHQAGGESDSCLQAHIFDYGASNCIKFEINAGFHSNATGTYLFKCDAVDCCYEGDQPGEPPDLKQWDIFHSDGHWNPTHPVVRYLGKRDTTELNGVKVANADVWSEKDHLPFTNASEVNYTYYITTGDNSSDVISHRIDYTTPGAPPGSILYGDFQVQHDIPTFRDSIKRQVPPECNAANIMPCNSAMIKKWRGKLPRSFQKNL